MEKINWKKKLQLNENNLIELISSSLKSNTNHICLRKFDWKRDWTYYENNPLKLKSDSCETCAIRSAKAGILHIYSIHRRKRQAHVALPSLVDAVGNRIGATECRLQLKRVVL